MVAVSVRRRGNSWQVRVGSGKAQHSIGSFKTYAEAVSAMESAKVSSVDSVEDNYSKQLVALAKQLAEEAVRERKEWIESYLIENSSCTADLLKNAGQAAVMASIAYDSSSEVKSEFDLDSYKSVEVKPVDLCSNSVAKLTEEARLSLYESYYESAVGNTTDFNSWYGSLTEDDLNKLDCWISKKWNVTA